MAKFVIWYIKQTIWLPHYIKVAFPFKQIIRISSLYQNTQFGTALISVVCWTRELCYFFQHKKAKVEADEDDDEQADSDDDDGDANAESD